MVWAYNQTGGLPGWNTGIFFDNGGGLGSWPIKTTGTLIKTGGGGTITNGIDLSNTTISGNAFVSTGFAVNGAGSSLTLGAQLTLQHSTNYSIVYDGSGSTQTLILGNSGDPTNYYRNTTHLFQNINGATNYGQFASSGGFAVGTTSDPGLGSIYINNATFMMRTKTSFTNGAGASAGTLGNAPAAGNPTKWIAIDDNGTTRQIPAW
jgi:hypothetical protein